MTQPVLLVRFPIFSCSPFILCVCVLRQVKEAVKSMQDSDSIAESELDAAAFHEVFQITDYCQVLHDGKILEAIDCAVALFKIRSLLI